MQLRSFVIVEGSNGQAWTSVTTEMNLVRACREATTPPPACVTLAPGEAVSPPAWRGWSCSGQCNMICDKNVYRGSGPFRFKVEACATGTAFVSDSFVMPRVPTRPGDDL